tara:strand:- start:237 stop:347 length:111 start_codon:yes stop_codon:yes gene_type:complete
VVEEDLVMQIMRDQVGQEVVEEEILVVVVVLEIRLQ